MNDALLIAILVVLAAVAVTSMVFASLSYFGADDDKAAVAAGAALAGADGATGPAGPAGASPVVTYHAILDRHTPVTVAGTAVGILGTVFVDGATVNVNGVITNVVPDTFAIGDSTVARVFRCALDIKNTVAPGTQPAAFTVSEGTIVVTTVKGGTSGTDGSTTMGFVADLAVPAGVTTITPSIHFTAGYPGGTFLYTRFDLCQIE